jgi:hypothetical protein
MGISAVGQDARVATIRHAIATVLVALGLFGFFYGPPLAPNMSAAAREACNEMTGSDYRSFSLVWRTTTYDSVDAPHWVCYDLSEPGHPGTSLGWWAGF